MVDTTTLNENLRSPIDGTEQVRLATPNANWRALIGSLGPTNVRLAKTANYTVASGDAGKTIALGGNAFFSLTFPAASGLASNFIVFVVNEDVYSGTGSARGKSIISSGSDFSQFILWPGQSIIVVNQNNKWQIIGQSRWRPGGVTVELFLNASLGNDNNDGLNTGSGNAMQTIQGAVATAARWFDLDFQSAPQVLMRLADGTYNGGLHYPGLLVGAAGNASLFITGNAVTPTNVIVAGDGGGGAPFALFNNALLEVENMLIQDANAGALITCESGSQCRIQGGITLGNCASGASQLQVGTGGKIIADQGFSISGNAATGNGFLMNAGDSGLINCQGQTITFTVNVTYSTTVICGQAGNINVGGVTWTLGGHTVTGQRYQANNVGNIMTFGGGPNAIPGNAAGSTANGGTYF